MPWWKLQGEFLKSGKAATHLRILKYTCWRPPGGWWWWWWARSGAREMFSAASDPRESSVLLSRPWKQHTASRSAHCRQLNQKPNVPCKRYRQKKNNFDISNIIKHLTTARTLTNIALLPNKQTKTFRQNLSPNKEYMCIFCLSHRGRDTKVLDLNLKTGQCWIRITWINL